MSWPKSSLGKRVLTALSGLILIFSIWHFFQNTGLYILSSFAFLLLGFEVGTLTFRRKSSFFPHLFINAIWFFVFFKTRHLDFIWGAVACHIILWLLISRILQRKQDEIFISSRSVYPFLFFTTLLPTLTLAHINPVGDVYTFINLLFGVFLFDTASYFCGKSFGKKIFKLDFFPQISPSKTLEGALGGGLLSFACLMWLSESFPNYTAPFSSIENTGLRALALVVFLLAALAGDLAESIFKRTAKFKDSSNLLPGHGGFFDRLDGVLLASLISYMLLQL